MDVYLNLLGNTDDGDKVIKTFYLLFFLVADLKLPIAPRTTTMEIVDSNHINDNKDPAIFSSEADPRNKEKERGANEQVNKEILVNNTLILIHNVSKPQVTLAQLPTQLAGR